MCGIVGFWKSSCNDSAKRLGEIASNMADTLVHRGPDDGGIWVDADMGIALGHRRLSIIDISENGHQPMFSENGRYVITYNGEVYNFRELRSELKKLGHRFRGHSDTEVILAAISEWGLEKAVSVFDGMYAFALWDRKDSLLCLVRDRIGEKPLYYGVQNGTFFFASELKAIRAHPAFQPQINRDAIVSFLRFSYVPAPHSIYRGVYKLLPGHFLCLNSPLSMVESEPYWFLEEIVLAGVNNPFPGSEAEAVDELETRLKKTVRSRMISDVPLGAFLSGGIDSSTIVALMQATSSRPVNTYTIGFHESEFNEATHAKKVAEHIGTNHTEHYVTPQEAMEIIPKLPVIYDEPFADSSQIPTSLISVLTREYVPVSLSGDGGDELFGGYIRYFIFDRYWNTIRMVPYFFRKWVAGAISSIPVKYVDGLYNEVERFLPQKVRQSLPVEKFYKLGQVLSHSSIQNTYKRLVSVIAEPNHLATDGRQFKTLIDDPVVWETIPEHVTAMQYLDLMTYHPNDILTKVDRASMAVSLEARAPYLSKEIIEFALKLPLSMRVRNGQGKWILRQVLHRYVPENIVERTKMGFGVPIGEWLKGPLRSWAESLISQRSLERDGYLNALEINCLWQQHLSGHYNHAHILWNILMFQAWLEIQ